MNVSQSASHCTVEVASGTIKGAVTQLPDGSACYCFRGIPYAVPPTTEALRFRSPVPLDRHTPNPLDCTTEREVSLASSYLPPDSVGSENCLFLNVYAPVLGESGIGGRPVMVWLHGGAFCTGSGDSSIYHPQWLVQQRVIVVTVNYRLGPAGFLCLPSVGIDGNMGLKDQRLALRWVRRNIHVFGGQPENVTLFGESAGGVSAHLHCLSPEPLFQKIILQSGVATSPIVFAKDAESKARRLATFFGCKPDASDEEVLETLNSVPPDQLAKHQKEALTPYERTLDSVYAFRPTIESASSRDPVVTEDVFTALSHPECRIHRIPMIIGVTDGEALYKINTFRQHIDRYRQEASTRFIPDTLRVPNEERSAVAQQIVDFYCGPEGITLQRELALSRIFTDILYLYPAVQATELHLRNRGGPLYFYTFECDTELNKFRRLWKVPEEYRGASHADDVCYLFSSSYFNTDQPIDVASKAYRLRESMCRLWTNFAKTGQPTTTTDDGDGEIHWRPVEDPTALRFSTSTLCIGEEIAMKEQRELDARIQFWRQLYVKYNRAK